MKLFFLLLFFTAHGRHRGAGLAHPCSTAYRITGLARGSDEVVAGCVPPLCDGP
jgi:hypothetical protein